LRSLLQVGLSLDADKLSILDGTLANHAIVNELKKNHLYHHELHDALMKKNEPEFWKCWRSKFETGNKCDEVDGCIYLFIYSFIYLLKLLVIYSLSLINLRATLK
jgi:hypothetical protein